MKTLYLGRNFTRIAKLPWSAINWAKLSLTGDHYLKFFDDKRGKLSASGKFFVSSKGGLNMKASKIEDLKFDMPTSGDGEVERGELGMNSLPAYDGRRVVLDDGHQDRVYEIDIDDLVEEYTDADGDILWPEDVTCFDSGFIFLVR